jgi:transcriptional regulator with XRE-family HTH domain
MAVKVSGASLREAREDALLSQRELGERAQISPDTIVRLEAEEGLAYGRTVRKIANALGVDYRALLEVEPGKALARQ